jgi:hypothetical protein
MIELGQYETVDGLTATVLEWNKQFEIAVGYVLDYPVKGETYNTAWSSNGEEVDDKDELDLDID